MWRLQMKLVQYINKRLNCQKSFDTYMACYAFVRSFLRRKQQRLMMYTAVGCSAGASLQAIYPESIQKIKQHSKTF